MRSDEAHLPPATVADRETGPVRHGKVLDDHLPGHGRLGREGGGGRFAAAGDLESGR